MNNLTSPSLLLAVLGSDRVSAGTSRIARIYGYLDISIQCDKIDIERKSLDKKIGSKPNIQKNLENVEMNLDDYCYVYDLVNSEEP